MRRDWRGNAYVRFIKGFDAHSWRVRGYAPWYAFRNAVASLRNAWQCDRRISVYWPGVRDRFMLAWSGRPTCGLPMYPRVES